MEDTKSLLIMVLHKIFHDRLKVVEDTYQLIYNYNNGKRQKSEYERTLKNICDLMNDEVPSQILVYLLTLVDMPNEDGNELPIMQKIQKTYSCLAESVRPSLLEYLAVKKEDKVVMQQNDSTSEEGVKCEILSKNLTDEITDDCIEYNSLEDITEKCETTGAENNFSKSTKRIRTRRKVGTIHDSESVKSLLDITANYVINNELLLKNIYKAKLTEAWKLINSNVYYGDTLKQCYIALDYINKQVKLLRCIENDNICNIADFLSEEYKDHDILLKESNMYHEVNANPFQVNEELIEKIKFIVHN